MQSTFLNPRHVGVSQWNKLPVEDQPTIKIYKWNTEPGHHEGESGDTTNKENKHSQGQQNNFKRDYLKVHKCIIFCHSNNTQLNIPEDIFLGTCVIYLWDQFAEVELLGQISSLIIIFKKYLQMIREIEGTRTILKDKNKQKLEDLENDQIELLEMKKQCHENLKLNHRLNTK